MLIGLVFYVDTYKSVCQGQGYRSFCLMFIFIVLIFKIFTVFVLNQMLLKSFEVFVVCSRQYLGFFLTSVLSLDTSDYANQM